MLLKLFKQSKPIMLVFVLILAIIPRAILLFNQETIPVYSPEYPLLTDFWLFFENFPVISLIVSFLILFIQASWLNRIAVKNGLIKQNCLFPILLYILLCNSFFTNYFSPVILGQLFLLFGVDNLLKIYPAKQVQQNLFRAAVLFSIATIVCPELLFFILSIPVFFAIYGITGLKRWLVSLLGFILPIFLLATYSITIAHVPTEVFVDHFSPQIQMMSLFQNINQVNWISVGFISIYLLIAFSDMNKAFSKKNIQKRFSLSYLLWLFPFSLSYFLISKDPGGFILMCSPIAFLLSNFYMYRRESTKLSLGFSLLILTLLILSPISSFLG